MSLDEYGVLLGTLTGHRRDTPDNEGRWFHVNLDVTAPAGRYRCAVDVDSKHTTTGVQWRTTTLHPSQLPVLSGRPAGLHRLPMSAAGGAVDYQRHPAFRPALGCLAALAPFVPGLEDFVRRQGWSTGSNLDAATALEAILVAGARIVCSASRSRRAWACTTCTRTRAIRRTASGTRKTAPGRTA